MTVPPLHVPRIATLAFHLLAFTAFLCPVDPLPAQVLPFHSLTTADGLAGNRITALCQDSKGYLWIGTFDGLSVYDGLTFKNYTVTDGLASSLVWCIAESRRTPGTMWIGTEGGLSNIRDGIFSTVRLGPGTGAGKVYSLLEDRAGTLWYTTGNGIHRRAGDSVTVVVPVASMATVSNLVESADGRVWAAVGHRLFAFSPGNGSRQEFSLMLAASVTISALSADNEGDLWISRSDSVVTQFRGTRAIKDSYVPTGTSGLLLDHEGFLWMGSRFAVTRIAKTKLGKGSWEYITPDQGAPNDIFSPVLLDHENTLWFGTWDHGITRLSERNNLRLSKRGVTSYVFVDFDSHNHAWIASDKGLLELWSGEGGTWKSHMHMINGVVGQAFDKQQRMWVLSLNGQVRCYAIRSDGHHYSSMTLLYSLLPGIDFPRRSDGLSLYIDGNLLWLSLQSDLVVVIDIREKPVIRKLLRFPDDIPVTSVREMFRDHTGTMWFASFEDGLAELPAGDWVNGRFKRYTTADGLPDNHIRALSEDVTGRLWIGTRYNGLAIKEDRAFKTLTAADGLLSNTIRSISPGDSSNMWVGTSLGVLCIDARTLRRTWRNRELAGQSAIRCKADGQGRVWTLVPDAISVCDYRQHLQNVVPPPVYIAGLTVNGTPFSHRTVPALSYDQNNLAIGFAGISFRDGNNVRYRYRLIGIDRDWSPPTPQRGITYAALAPGSYSFEVVAINADGIASNEPARLSFIIAAPFWQRGWFIALTAALLLATVGGTVRYVSLRKLQGQIRQLETEKAILAERERTRERIARDLHDDVASTLGSVVLYSEFLKRQLESTSESGDLVRKIGSLSLEAQETMDDIVWATSPQHDTLKELLIRIRDLASATCTAGGITYAIQIPETIPDMHLPDEIRKSIFLIFKEALNNIFKHAHATKVVIETQMQDGLFRLTLTDNGSGIAAGGTPSRGHGLRNMAKRAAEIGAEFSITRGPGGGTVVSLSRRMT
jgi:signal transduction histidine kinase/ligand-binding sensor domain-containing protein